MSPTKAQRLAAEERAAAKAAKEAEEAETSWYEMATPTGDYLPKLEGINCYELLDEGQLKEGEIEGRPTQNVEFAAIHHESTTFRGKKLADSPDEPVEAILSVPLSAARKIRVEMEEKELKEPDLIGMILVIQRTGEGKKTRYPSIELIESKEYFSEE